MTNKVYARVTASILAELEKGAAPWIKPWSGMGSGSMPRNAASGRAYSGINIIMLWMAREEKGFSSAKWLTFKQALDLGGHVRKGEKSERVVFVNMLEREDDDGKVRKIPFLKEYSVFNVEQCDGLPADMMPKPQFNLINIDQRDAVADEFLKASGAHIVEEGGRAFYRPATDSITLPPFTTFRSSDNFYATAFHELAHWTGHESRLARDFSGRFGDRAYAAEELVAELTAAFLCAEFSMDGELRHAGYIESWIGLLKEDDRAFFTAAAKAQKAADYLRQLALDGAPADYLDAAE